MSKINSVFQDINVSVVEPQSSEVGYVQLFNPSNFYQRWKKVSGPRLQTDHRYAIIDFYSEFIYAQTNKNYISFLESLEFDSAEAWGHIESWEEFFCKNRHVFLYPNAVVGPLNPFANAKAVRSAVSRTYRKLESIDYLENLFGITFTFPREVRPSDDYEGSIFPNETPAFLVKRAWKCYELMIKRLEEFLGVKLGSTANLHTWETKNPMYPHLHIHSLFLDFVKSHSGIEKKFLRPNMFMDREAVTDFYLDENDNYRKKYYQTRPKSIWKEGFLTRWIKRVWTEIVNKEFNLNYERIDVHFKFIDITHPDGKGKLLHWLKYVKRRPLLDLALWFIKNKFDSVDFKSFNKFNITYQNKTRCFGLWRNLKLYANRPVSKTKIICPICGTDAFPTGRNIEIEDFNTVDFLKIDRRNNFYLRNRTQTTILNKYVA